MIPKHYSKLLKGFNKMVVRQEAKEEEVIIQLPTSIKLPKNFKGEYIHEIHVTNSRWNGMNLKELRNRLIVNKVGGMYSPFYINKDGKYKLSLEGQRRLKKRKQKLDNSL